MGFFTQQLINGLTLGAIYGLIAVGYTMVYGIIGMINFAHGEIFMIGTFCVFIFFLVMGSLFDIASIPFALLAALTLAVFVTSLYGWTMERMAYKPLRNANRLAPLITAIGMSIFFQNYVQLTQGAKPKAFPSLNLESFTLFKDGHFDVQINLLQVLVIVLTVVLMGIFWLIIQKTNLGRAQRACAQDKKMASLLGINVDKTISITFIMGASLATIAGMIYMLRYGTIDFYIGFMAGIKAFTAAVLGGIGSLPGAMLGGFLIGIVEALWSGYFQSAYQNVAAFVVLVVILIFRPSGLLGRPEIEKV